MAEQNRLVYFYPLQMHGRDGPPHVNRGHRNRNYDNYNEDYYQGNRKNRPVMQVRIRVGNRSFACQVEKEEEKASKEGKKENGE